jgi:hypothetical protein
MNGDFLKENLIFCGKIIGIGFISFLFVANGLDMLVFSYRIKNPVEFIALFFASNFLILISLVGFIYLFQQIRGRLTGRSKKT